MGSPVEVVDLYGFDYEWFSKLPMVKHGRGNPGVKKKKRNEYISCVSSFDIETTRLEEIDQSIMYIWQWDFNNYQTVVGRTWEEFCLFWHRLRSCRKDDERLVVYVHNLSYEFQFLQGVEHFRTSDVFAMESRKILKATLCEFLEFRCSYIHTNMSLDKFLKNMGVERQKVKGFDYSVKRFPWTPLTESELDYCLADVQGLTEAIQLELLRDSDTLATIPLTSTGYVRRDMKKAMKGFDHRILYNLQPSLELYEILREAFRGGDTHANRYFSGQILDNVKSDDRSSSYPEVMMNRPYPMTPFFKVRIDSRDQLERWIFRIKRALVFRVSFRNIQLKDPYTGCPYLAYDKCRNVKGFSKDNGRILSAAYLETTMTDVDYRILNLQYTFEIVEVSEAWKSTYKPLPKQFRDVVEDYYIKKTKLKNIQNDPETGRALSENEKAEYEYIYARSKARLNALYGMCATDPLKDEIEYCDPAEKDYAPDFIHIRRKRVTGRNG